MKLLDERGRIGGKINIIDLLVILAVVAVAVFAAGKLFQSSGGGGDSVKLTYTVLIEEVLPATYESVMENVPSRMMASGSLLDGSVIAAEAEPHAIYTENTRGELVRMEDSILLDVTFTAEVMVPRQGVQLNTVGTQEIRIGKDHYLKTEYFEFMGTITTATWEGIG